MSNIHLFRRLEITSGPEAQVSQDALVEHKSLLVIRAGYPTICLRHFGRDLHAWYFNGSSIVKRDIIEMSMMAASEVTPDIVSKFLHEGRLIRTHMETAKIAIEPKFDNGASLARAFMGLPIRMRWVDVDPFSDHRPFPAADVNDSKSVRLEQDLTLVDRTGMHPCPIIGHWLKKGKAYNDYLLNHAIINAGKEILRS